MQLHQFRPCVWYRSNNQGHIVNWVQSNGFFYDDDLFRVISWQALLGTIITLYARTVRFHIDEGLAFIVVDEGLENSSLGPCFYKMTASNFENVLRHFRHTDPAMIDIKVAWKKEGF